MPGDNIKIKVKLIAPIAMEEGTAVCDPRRRSDRRCRRGFKSHRVSKMPKQRIRKYALRHSTID